MSARKFIIGGNWKMHKTPSEAVATAKSLKLKLINVEGVDVVICPPAIDLVPVRAVLKETQIQLGGQNIHWQPEGAFTGETAASMLVNGGCSYVIIGHSERRHVFGETDAEVNKKIGRALQEGLRPIFCIGETLEERNGDRTEEVLERQVRQGLEGISVSSADAMVIAYEPVWAIGTGVNATPEQAEAAHQYVRNVIAEILGGEVAAGIRIQYGGSVKPDNAEQLLGRENIDGALVGGASLDSESFTAIIKAAEKLS